jgi:phosphoenolpyruvate phosphomutase
MRFETHVVENETSRSYPYVSYRKTTRLRSLLQRETLDFLMEAHDGLSARIAENIGFMGLWASGLTISTALGYRDANEASPIQVLDAVERMADVTDVPILVDGDTGYGNFNNARLFAKKLCDRGAAGVCIEDKIFPKLNSFVGEDHDLAEIPEFCGRLRAIRDRVPDRDFVTVARTEALIAGKGQNEALDRAHAYAEAGADAILIHSRQANASEIFAFADRWQNRLPVVIVPTKYHSTPTCEFAEKRISVAIWANHNMRAAARAMEDVCLRISNEGAISGVEKDVMALDRIFELFKYCELDEASRRY